MANSKDTHACTLDKIISLCKRRGFVYQSSEIYGGQAGAWDYGPLGVELKRNIQNAWWKYMTQMHDDVVGLDGAIFMHHTTWEASGHVGHFSDPMIDCCECKARFRADQLIEDFCSAHNEKTEKPVDTMSHDEMKAFIDGKINCPTCGKHSWTDVREFNLMFKTHLGPVANDASLVYLRPETCQSIFVDFKNIVQSNRMKVPFGVAQYGKSFRNEITPRRFTFRMREFEQMEIEYFVRPEDADRAFKSWVDCRYAWYKKLGIKEDKLRLRQHEPDELAHYAKGCYDVEYFFPWGWGELEGIANRSDFDLTRHSEYSGKSLSYFDPDTNEHIMPWVIEPSGGVDRATFAFIADAYDEDTAISAKGQEEVRVVLHLHPRLAPVQVAVLPLLKNKPQLVEKAKELEAKLRRHFLVDYDERGQIGKRYRRYDEIGTPCCLTVDFDTLEDDTVTVRDRDTMQQERIKIADLRQYLNDKLCMDMDF